MISKTNNGMRPCNKCKQTLPVGAFTRLKKLEGLPTPHDTYCKACRSEVTKESQRKRARQDGPAASKRRYDNANLKRNHGITIDDYDDMLVQQGGLCAICGTDDPRGKGRFYVDHDHDTGKTRGLLCARCNTGIGMLKDSPSVLASAINYLNRHGKKCQ